MNGLRNGPCFSNGGQPTDTSRVCIGQQGQSIIDQFMSYHSFTQLWRIISIAPRDSKLWAFDGLCPPGKKKSNNVSNLRGWVSEGLSDSFNRKRMGPEGECEQNVDFLTEKKGYPPSTLP